MTIEQEVELRQGQEIRAKATDNFMEGYWAGTRLSDKPALQGTCEISLDYHSGSETVLSR